MRIMAAGIFCLCELASCDRYILECTRSEFVEETVASHPPEFMYLHPGNVAPVGTNSNISLRRSEHVEVSNAQS
jgi:hypothetical protein